MFISPAYAQAAGGQGGGLTFIIPLILIFVVFYFLLIRPQQKRMKEHQNMVANLRRGDRIVTGGGVVGTVTKVIDDNEVQVEISEGVRVRVMRQTVQQVMNKSEPADKGQGGAKEKDKESGESGGKGMLGKIMGGGKSEDSSSSADDRKS
jgi:preprotein translocase subunit YajC